MVQISIQLVQNGFDKYEQDILTLIRQSSQVESDGLLLTELPPFISKLSSLLDFSICDIQTPNLTLLQSQEQFLHSSQSDALMTDLVRFTETLIKKINKIEADFELDFESIKTSLLEYFWADPKFCFVMKGSGKSTILEIIEEISLEDIS